MFKESDLTPWFDGNTKPVRVGVYPRYYDLLRATVFSKWNGDKWLLTSRTVNAAEQALAPSVFQNLPWRGLAKDPQAPTPEESAQRITDKINEEHASGLDGDPEAPHAGE